MNKLFGISVIATVLAMGSVSAEKLQRTELNPMVLVELEAGIKADLIMAELYLTWDIRDDLENRSNVIIGERFDVESTVIIENDFDLDNNWTVAAQD